MPPELTGAFSFVACVIGIVALLLNHRSAGLKSQVDALRVEVGKLTERLLHVESENTQLRAAKSTHAEKRIEALEENRELRVELREKDAQLLCFRRNQS